MATEFNDEVVAVIKKDGKQISQTLYYSVNTYIQKNQNNTDNKLAELVQAIYNYGESAKLFEDWYGYMITENGSAVGLGVIATTVLGKKRFVK